MSTTEDRRQASAEWETIPTGLGMVDHTHMVKRLLAPHAGEPVSWRILPRTKLPAPGVCDGVRGKIYLSRDLFKGIDPANISSLEELIQANPRTLGIMLHELAHHLYSPSDMQPWAHGLMEIIKIQHDELSEQEQREIVTTLTLAEEVRIEKILLDTAIGEKPGKLPPICGIALEDTSIEQICRGLAENIAQIEESGDSLTRSQFSRAVLLAYGRVVAGIVACVGDARVVVDALHGVVAERMGVTAGDPSSIEAVMRIEESLRQLTSADGRSVRNAYAFNKLIAEIWGDDTPQQPGQPGEEQEGEPRQQDEQSGQPGDEQEDEQEGEQPGQPGQPGDEQGDEQEGEQEGQPGDEQKDEQADEQPGQPGDEQEDEQEQGEQAKRLKQILRGMAEKGADERHDYEADKASWELEDREKRITRFLDRKRAQLAESRERRLDRRANRVQNWEV